MLRGSLTGGGVDPAHVERIGPGEAPERLPSGAPAGWGVIRALPKIVTPSSGPGGVIPLVVPEARNLKTGEPPGVKVCSEDAATFA